MVVSKMRAVQVSYANGPLELVERDIPVPTSGSVRIKVQACGICHSDSFTKEGTFPGLKFPRIYLRRCLIRLNLFLLKRLLIPHFGLK